MRKPSLIDMHVDVLFTRRASGALVATRDPSPRPAPRAFLGRSVEGNVWAVREDLDPETRQALARLLAAEPVPAAIRPGQGPECRARSRALLHPIRTEHRGPAFVLGQELPTDARAREVTIRDALECREAFPWLAVELDAVSPVAIAFEGGEPAAICHSPRGMTAAAAEAGVETLERFRGRGLATAAVACWARAILRRGRIPLYSTSWENEASQRVARRLAARLYGEDWHVT